MLRWESLEEYEHDDLSRDITNLTAKITEISLRKEKKRPVIKELKDLRSLVKSLKEMLLEAGQRPKPSAKTISSPLSTAPTRILTRQLFLHVQKGLEIGYDEQFTVTIRSLVEKLRTSLEIDSVHLRAEPSKAWQPADDDKPQTSAWDVVDNIDWMEEPLPAQNMTDPEEYQVDLDALNMPVLQWPGMYIPPKPASLVKLKWRRRATSRETDGSNQGKECESEEGSGKEGSGKEDSVKEDSVKTYFSEDEEADEGVDEIKETTEVEDANFFLDSAEESGAGQAGLFRDEEADEEMEETNEVDDANFFLDSAEESSSEVPSERGSDRTDLFKDEEADDDMEGANSFLDSAEESSAEPIPEDYYYV